MISAPSRWLLIITSIACTGYTARAQQFIETPDGRTEVIGLRRWTASMLADSLGLRAPGVSLFQTKECTAALYANLHFSSVFIDKMIVGGREGQTAQSVVIRLLEPQDARRIRWRLEPPDSGRLQPAWRDLARLLGDSGSTFFHEGRLEPLQAYALFLRIGLDSALKQMAFAQWDTASTAALWRTVQIHHTPRDRALAIQALRSDGNRRNRMMAAAILMNFAADDQAWRALVEAVRDPYTGVNHTAMMSLMAMGTQFPRAVDWTPSARSLRALLDGTNMPEFLTLVQVLVQTSISPKLAPALLRGGGDLVLAHANAKDRRSHDAAVGLLSQLSGRTGPSAKWRAWVAAL